MSALRAVFRRLRSIFRPATVDRELDREIALHLELETTRNLAQGMSPAEARRRAMVAFGGVEVTREAHRDGRGSRWFRDFIGDVRYAIRTLRRNPVLTATAVVTLALGIGANTAIFSAVNAVMLRPLPLPQPDRLVQVWEQNPDRGWYQADAAPANYLDWHDQVKSFADVAAYPSFAQQVTLTGDGAPLLLSGANVTGNFFSVLGVAPERGRAFTDAETWNNGAAVVVISHRLWRDRFGSSPAIIGTSILLDRRPVQVVGVMPPTLAFPFEGTDIWLPTAWTPADRGQVWFRRAHFVRVIARLRPGVSLPQATAELQTVMRRLEHDFPETNRHMGAGLTPLHEFLTGSARTPLLVLLGAVALLMLIACANVGNLLLVQAAGRDREFAVRVALGAGRLRLARQAITGSLVLSLAGGAVGLIAGWFGTRLLLAMQPPGMLPVSEVSIDWRVILFVLAVTLVSGVLFGLAPAVWGARRAPAEGLRAAGRSGGIGARGRRFSDAVIVGEEALALLLTVGAGLLTRSLLRLQRVDAGLDSSGVLAASLSLPDVQYDSSAKVAGFYDQLQQQTLAIPGVRASAVTSQLPLTAPSWSSDFVVMGRAPRAAGMQVVHRTISPDYLTVMRVPLLKGRGFTSQDAPGTPRPVLINQALATRFFPGEDPLGLRIAFDRVPDSTSVWRTIVGVVGSEHQAGLESDPEPEIFEPFAQDARSFMTLVVRTSGDPATVAPAVRDVIRRLDPDLAILKMRSMSDVRQASFARPRFMTVLFLAFALVGVVLAMVGVYGVIAQLARQRSREMSIRLALGARTGEVRWLVVRHGLRLTAFGVVMGSILAALATRSLQGLLFGVASLDPFTFVAVPVLLGLTALAATWIPGTRAARSDPAVALREE